MRHAVPRLLAAILGLALIAASASAGAQAALAPRGGGVKGGGSPGAPDGTPRLPTGPLFGLDGPPTVPGAGGQPQNQGPHDPDLLVIVFRPGTPDGTTTDFAGAFKLTIEKQFELSGLRLRVFLMRIPAGSSFADVQTRATADRRPLWVQPDFRYQSLQSTQGAAQGTTGATTGAT